MRVRFELSNAPSLYSVHVQSSDSCEAASRLMTICFDDADFLRSRFSGVDAIVSASVNEATSHESPADPVVGLANDYHPLSNNSETCHVNSSDSEVLDPELFDFMSCDSDLPYLEVQFPRLLNEDEFYDPCE